MFSENALISENEFSAIFRNKIPLLDVRAEVEFAKGHIPNSTNIPILNNHERELVGKYYKNFGQDKAISLGKQITAGSVLEKRINLWQKYLKNNPHASILCFRGGLRSKITQKLLLNFKIEVPRIDGGFKALRNYLRNSLDRCCNNNRFIILGGKTGVGKTDILNNLDNKLKNFKMLDLENLANHRGSAFGGKIEKQPSQIVFENLIAYHLFQVDKFNKAPIFLENESSTIGRLHIPQNLFKAIQRSELIIIEQSIEKRVANIHKTYIKQKIKYLKKLKNLKKFNILEEALFIYQDIKRSLIKIQRKLGGVEFKNCLEQLKKAYLLHKNQNTTEGYSILIKNLLSKYYDPLYNFQASKYQDRILFKGKLIEVQDYILKILNK